MVRASSTVVHLRARYSGVISISFVGNPIEPEQAFVVHRIPLSFHQHMQTPITEAPALVRRRLEPVSQCRVVRPKRT